MCIHSQRIAVCMILRMLAFVIMVVLLAKPIISFCRHSAFWGRKRLTEEELMKMFDCGYKSLEFEALRFLSSAYEVPMGLLRPSDTFTEEGALWKWDSWSFGEGQDRLNEFVWSHGLEGEHPDWTIADFVIWYVASVGKKGTRYDS